MPIRGFTSQVKVHDEFIPVNPDINFRRISLLKKSDAELQKYFEFELAPFPSSLFDEGGLRKTLKSIFSDLFSTATVVHFTSACYVVDGGFLLHRVLRQAEESFSFIMKKYFDFAKKHFNGTQLVMLCFVNRSQSLCPKRNFYQMTRTSKGL
ncbi:hypothetical protein AVEN_60980-1 [Araneus ventricosus]|uniref:Uncharacterized protein n=1 Tax=Araneus ventricosus TaxID=182803 RepID=A0A4Y2DE62_ARAVE|nr:hypothetical protein AVEN_60980-1 [Araneus ventricosus]